MKTRTPIGAAAKNVSIRRSGFALVVTLTLMVLLSILALGLLSLSSIELRKNGIDRAQSLARQNARLALNLAIGELQKNLGSDKRTSATAGLLDESAKNPYWTGAWNTEGGFRGWLVSGNETIVQPADPATSVAAGDIPFTPATAATANPASPTGFFIGTTPAVLLVGEQSLGSAASIPKNLVFAPVQEITESAGNKKSGRYAWWVGDEGVKANLNSPVLALPADEIDKRLLFRSGSPNRGFPTLGGSWANWLPDGDAALLPGTEGKIVSRSQIALAQSPPPAGTPASGSIQAGIKEHFHDFTVASAGVLSDSKSGGLRKDLSIAFEIPESSFKNSEFTRLLSEGEAPDAYVTNHGSSMNSSSPLKNRLTKTIVNHSDPLFSGGKYRALTFDLLRDHYQLYRRFPNPFSASASLSAQQGGPYSSDLGKSPWQEYSDRLGGGPTSGSFAIADTAADGKPSIRQMTTEFVPELIHFAYALSLQSYKETGDPPDQSRIRIIVNPFFALYNPYNIVLNSPPIHMRIARAEVAIKLSGKNYSLQEPYVDSDSFQDAGAGYQQIDHIISDSGDPHPSSGSPSITLKPGEIKLYTISGGRPVDIDSKFQSSNKFLTYEAVASEDIGQLFSSGVYSMLRYISGAPLLVDDSATLTASADNSTYINSKDKPHFPELGNDWNEYFMILEKFVQPFSGDPDDNKQNAWPHFREIRTFNDLYWQGEPKNNSDLTLNAPQMRGDINDPGGGERFYIAQSDFHWKTAVGDASTDNNFSLATLNPRAPAQSATASGAQGANATRGPATWTASVQRLDGSRPDFNLRFWGTGKDIQDGGQQFLTIWDIPRKPITSLAAFQHANAGRLFTDPAYIIGNSYASPYVPGNALAVKSSGKGYWNFDNSYLFNQSLFDSYFFSGVHPGTDGTSWRNRISNSSVRLAASDPAAVAPLQAMIDEWTKGSGRLGNPRMTFVPPSGGESQPVSEALNLAQAYQIPQTKLSAQADVRPHNAIAAYILNSGAFNVNSVSVPAWRAVLAGLRGAPVDHFSNPASLGVDTGATSPFAATTMPGADSATGGDQALWNGYRRLEDVQIESLAREIVAGIKDRTRDNQRPFTTLGEFVNRRLKVNSPHGLSGILQAAIDSSGLNSPTDLSAVTIDPADTNHQTKKKTNPRETVSTEYANVSALAASTIAGAPQWLTQADVLETVGPQLSARSDTFTIRAYGESVNPVTGVTQGRAWLEATVQRGTGFVDPSDPSALPFASLKSAANLKFGRRFHITALRWLSRGEI